MNELFNCAIIAVGLAVIWKLWEPAPEPRAQLLAEYDFVIGESGCISDTKYFIKHTFGSPSVNLRCKRLLEK